MRSAPGEGRSGRDQLDLALAAVADERELALFFLGDGVLHLVRERDPRAADWPAGHRGWESLSELGPVLCYAEAGRVAELAGAGIELMLEPELLGHEDLAAAWRDCRWVVTL